MILDQVCDRSPVKISIKVRLGVSDKSELMKLIPVLNKYPLSEVIVHPRTAEQMYNSTVDLDAFEEAFQALEQTVCYNGDINDLAFFQSLEKRFPTLGRFMLGRGLLANPFLCEAIKSAHMRKCADPIPRIEKFHTDLVSRYESVLHGDHPVLGKMKEFWTYQAEHLSNGRQLFKKLKKTQRLGNYKAIVSEYLAEAEWMA
jgi:tRNA-dihydrouridine synthase